MRVSLAALTLTAGLLAPAALAQTPPAAPAGRAVSETAPAAAPPMPGSHVFQIVDGAVMLDGIAVPNAVPADLDLGGLSTQPLQYTGAISPVIEVDGRAYVFEGGRLVSIAESSRPRAGRFMLDDIVPEPPAMETAPDRELALVGQELYMRDVAVQDRGLWEKLHMERVLETQALQLADRVRATPAGPARDALRDELRELLSTLFTLKQDIRREEVARAQTELDALLLQLDERDRSHEAIVEGRLHALVGD